MPMPDARCSCTWRGSARRLASGPWCAAYSSADSPRDLVHRRDDLGDQRLRCLDDGRSCNFVFAHAQGRERALGSAQRGSLGQGRIGGGTSGQASAKLVTYRPSSAQQQCCRSVQRTMAPALRRTVGEPSLPSRFHRPIPGWCCPVSQS